MPVVVCVDILERNRLAWMPDCRLGDSPTFAFYRVTVPAGAVGEEHYLVMGYVVIGQINTVPKVGTVFTTGKESASRYHVYPAHRRIHLRPE